MTSERRKLRALVLSEDESVLDSVRQILSELDFSVTVMRDEVRMASREEILHLLSFDVITIYCGSAHAYCDEFVSSMCAYDLHPSLIIISRSDSHATKCLNMPNVRYLKRDEIDSLAPSIISDETVSNPLIKSRFELSESLTYVDLSLDAIPDVFAICDITGRLLRWNRALYELTGYSDEEISGMRIPELLTPESLEAYRRGIGFMLDGKEGISEVVLLNKEGKKIPVELRGRAIRDDSGRIIGFCGTAHELAERKGYENELITQLKRTKAVAEERAALMAQLNAAFKEQIEHKNPAEEELRVSREFMNSILENSLDLIMVFDPDGSVVFANPALRKILGREASDLEGQNILNLTHPEDRRMLLALWNSILIDGKQENPTECRFLHADGCWKTLEILGRRFQERNGKTRILVNARDITEKIQAQERLAETTETLRTFLDSTSEYAVLLDREQRIVTANKVLAESLGVPVRELVGVKLYESDLIEADVALNHSEKVTEVFENGKPVEFVDFHRGKFFEHKIFPVFDREGNVHRVAFFSTDITERKSFEEEIRKFETITEKANFGIALCDVEGNLIYSNPYFAGIHGYEPEQLKGKTIDVFHSEDQMPKVRELLERIVNEGSFSAEEVWHKRRDGSPFPTLMNGILIRNDDGTPRFLAATAIDITDLKKATEALAESEERHRLYFENSYDVLFSIDKSFRIVQISPSIVHVSGYTPEELTRLPFTDLPILSKDSLKKAVEDVMRVFKGDVVASQYELIAKDGERRVAEITAAPLLKEGKPSGIIAIARDITERKKTEEELLKLNTELDSYAATVSHDLRSPLSAIRLALDNFQRTWSRRQTLDEKDLEAEIERCREIIGEAVDRAAALINDLLALARAKQKPEFVGEVDIREIVEDVIRERSDLIGSSNATVSIDSDLGMVIANPSQMYQLFSNLIDNAIKHNTSETPRVSVKYFGKDRNGFHRYAVRDNGPGIPPEIADAIFVPFVKAKSKGTGIGLSIVEKIVRLYGGTIEAKNHRGALFEFTLKDYAGGAAHP